MWKPEDVARLPLPELRRLGAKRPTTLYEMHVLAAWARRAVSGEEVLEPVIEATVAALTEDRLLFGSPPGMLAAAVFQEASGPARDALWAAARARLDANSFDRLERALLNRRGSPEAPSPPSPPPSKAEGADLLTMWTYGRAVPLDTLAEAIAGLGLPVRIDAELSTPAAGELAIVTERGLSRPEIAAIVRACSAITNQPIACTLAADEGELGPDQVLYATPGAEPTLERVDLSTDPPEIVPHDMDIA